MPSFTEQLKILRTRAGLSQEMLAEFADVDRKTISRAESGRNLRSQTIFNIISAISHSIGRTVNPQDLIAEDEVEGPSLEGIGPTEFSRARVLAHLSEKNISYKELAERTGLAPRTISRVLSGDTNASRQTVMKITSALALTREDGTKAREDTRTLPPGWWDLGSDDLEEEYRKSELSRTANSIPDQNELIRFGVSDQNRLQFLSPLNDKNDYETIEALRSEMLAGDGPISFLKERYGTNPNAPQAALFGPVTKRYSEELSKDPREINYVTLYARGARFYAARRTAAQQVSSGEWPDLDAEESDAVDAICDLHGPLIMATAAGRRLISNAHEYETTPEVYRKEEQVLKEFGEALSEESDLFEPDTIKAIKDITDPIPDDPQPARSRGARIVFAGSSLSVVVGGAAWYAAGGVVATAVVPAALAASVAFGGAFLWEVTKKTERFKYTTDGLAKRADTLIDQAELQADINQKVLLERMAGFVDRRHDILESVSKLRPEFGWVNRFLRKCREEQNNSQPRIRDGKQLHIHIVIFGPQGSGKATIGKMLAEKLGVQFFSFNWQENGLPDISMNAYLHKVDQEQTFARARAILEELGPKQPTVIDMGSLGNSFNEFEQLDGRRFFPVVLKYGRDGSPSEDSLAPPPLAAIQ